ncbi:MAG: hypothetical protein OEV85_01110 [Candidatus Thorarchaeota archaeon]|nr:hypothetical protein [Candidatus Thorarchaeota archaeon]
MDRSTISSKVAIFFWVFTVIIHIAIYLSYFIMGSLFLDDLAYSELTWEELVSMYPQLAYLISEHLRTMGLAVLIVEIFILYMVYLIFWRSSKQGWVLATISSVVICVTELVQTFPVLGFNIPYMAYIMMIAMIVLASAISGMKLFGKGTA